MLDIIKQLVAISPWAALLAYMLFVVYKDAKEDRAAAAQERQRTLQKLEELDKSIAALTNAIENSNTIRKRMGRSLKTYDRGGF